MANGVALVTGAGGEMGRLLVPELKKAGWSVSAMDLHPLPESVSRHCDESLAANLLDYDKMDAWIERHRPSRIFHLAALLSAKAEAEPDLAHQVNVDGTLHLFRTVRRVGVDAGQVIRFVFPSSIAVYGLPNATIKTQEGAINENQWTVPTGVYGCNKLYCELLGSFFSRRTGGNLPALDFRSIRFPGLISAETLPTGGTTDYAPEMVHAAAGNKPYSCFVAPETRLPFMTMPDAVRALLKLADAAPTKLTTRVFNIKGFSATAEELRAEIKKHYPAAQIEFDPIQAKQDLVDTWPADLDDSRARKDWGLAPEHDLEGAIARYLLPSLSQS